MTICEYVPTDYDVVEHVIDMFDFRPDDVFYDIGCGDGRLLIEAASVNNNMQCVGIEIRRDLAHITRYSVEDSRLDDRVRILEGNVFDYDISDATSVYIYMHPYGIHELRDKLRELEDGCRLISKDFPIDDWRFSNIRKIPGTVLYMYELDSM